MKVTKTSVHRLTIEKTCGCQATREYEDMRYTKPVAEGTFTACPKHNKGVVAEFAGEMLIEALDKEAIDAGKANTYAPLRTGAVEGDSGGVQAPGAEKVQTMGINMPKMRDKRDPLETKTRSRQAPTGPRPQNPGTGNLNVASVEDLTEEEMAEAGITMTGDIDGVAADSRIDSLVEDAFEGDGGFLDAQDAKSQGVPLKDLR